MTTRAQATGDAIENTIAKAEIAIEKVLRDLERDTQLRLHEVTVDTQNFKTAAVRISLHPGYIVEWSAEGSTR